MHPIHHLWVSTAAAWAVSKRRRSFPWLAWAASLLADADHLAWHSARTGRLDPSAAYRFFRQDPIDGPESRLLLHRAPVIGLGLLAGRFWPPAGDLALGLAFHRALDELTTIWRLGRRAYDRRLVQRLKIIVFARENHTCQGCGAAGVSLELHHRLPEAQGGPNHPDNLLALCRPCHDRAHGRPERPQ
ncbi:MAG: HNH endonuclease [Caldilineales bacterium]|nr:HNH endonuclease [Caldilineales bacterium]MCW5861378.1 HNH endonuclease [Caldilineales bacterium]